MSSKTKSKRYSLIVNQPSYSTLPGQAVAVNTTGKVYHEHNDDPSYVPLWRDSRAVKAYKSALETKHYLHYKMFIAIFMISVICVAMVIPYFYTLREVAADAARTSGASVVQGVHQLSVMITTFIALAIPLTANFYTPRLVDIFLKDKGNITFLVTFSVISAVSVFYESFLYEQSEAALVPYTIMTVSAVLGWIVIIPYYYYVMRFLDPEVIVDKVSGLVVREIHNTIQKKFPPAECRQRLNQCILQLGDTGFRSIDRKDSRTTVACIQALCYVLDIFREQKSRIDPRFFHVEASEFPMLTKSGLSWLSHSSLWVEEQILRQIQKSFSASLHGMPSIVSIIALALREQCVPLMTENHHDRVLLILYIRFYNTFLREAINNNNLRGIFNLYYQYSTLAKDLSKWCPELLPRVVKYLSIYGNLCSDKKMDVATQIINYDLGTICGYLFRVNNEYATKILDMYLAKKISDSSMKLERQGMIHSRLILGSFLLYIENLLKRDIRLEIQKVIVSLSDVSEADLIKAASGIVETVEELFWEITDRIVNFDYVPPQQRGYVIQLRDAVLEHKKHAADALEIS